MHIKNNKLQYDTGTQIDFKWSPNYSSGFNPKFLMLHYTANTSFSGAISTLTNPTNKVSAHFVLGRDGSLCQLVSLERKAWHAGASAYGSLTGLNAHSIGIELCNFGPLTLTNDKYYSWTKNVVPADQVYTDKKGEYWQSYPKAQLDVLYEMSTALVQEYGLIDVIRHSDVAPGRKRDPGPALNIMDLRQHLYGRSHALEGF